MDGPAVAFVPGQLQVVDHRVDDLQTAAVLGRPGHRITAEGHRAGPSLVILAAVRSGLAIPAAGVDDLDGTLPVPGPHLDLVLVVRPGVLDDVGAGLGESQGNVGARIGGDAEGLQAAIENLAGDRDAGGLVGQEQHHLDLHVIHPPARSGLCIGRPFARLTAYASSGPSQTRCRAGPGGGERNGRLLVNPGPGG